MLARLARQTLPFSVRLWLKRNVLHRFLKRLTLTDEDKKLVRYFRKHEVENAILLSGMPKSGNTWTRFVIFNYFNIINSNADTTLTFNQLSDIQCHIVNDDPSFTGRFTPPRSGFPVFYRTHVPYRRIYDYFDKVIYVYRNPLDVLVSGHHYFGDREEPFSIAPLEDREKLKDIDVYALHHIFSWILHYKTTVDKSHVILCYERMREDPYTEFHAAFTGLGFEVDEDTLRRSIKMSSFESIKKMEDETQQEHKSLFRGLTGKFTRSGETKQYMDVLDPGTIETIRQLIAKHGIDIDL